MNFKKFVILIIAISAVGSALFSQFAHSTAPAVSFLVGVISTAFIFYFSFSSSRDSEEEKPSTQTLYVGNLPYKANEANVRQLFSEHGEVFAVRLMKDKRTGKRRGFGFVVIASQDVDKVVTTLNDFDYMQRTLKVRVANDPKHPESESSQ